MSPGPLLLPMQQAADEAMARWAHAPHALLQILRETQQRTHWLPRPLLAHIASELKLGLAHVEGVASFYRFLHLQPVGQVRLLMSDNITDRHQGNIRLLDRLCQQLGIPAGQVSPDDRCSVDLTSCIGMGDQGPALLVNHDRVITHLDADRIDAMAHSLKAGRPPDTWPADWFVVEDKVRRADVLLEARADPGAFIRTLLGQTPDAWLATIRAAGLRGRGGAGFPVARKWEICRSVEAPDRCIVCNADEGEPGTFKDRVLLRQQAHAMIDGMTLAAWVTGARTGWIYLRGEYAFLQPQLEQVLRERRAVGWLGKNIGGAQGVSTSQHGAFDFDFDIGLHLGAGAYVCGEESALIESLEGKRGAPRIRPPYPVESGYRGMPTVVNNVETFCAAAWIAVHGAEAWARLGTADSTGTKLHSVSGDCERPGIYEYSMGTPVSTLLHDCGARSPQAVQVGGPSGHCIDATEFDRRLCFEDLNSAGAFMVFDASRDMFEVARHFAHFFAHESCGLCTPCRIGTELVVRRMDKLAQAKGGGAGSADDLAILEELDKVLHGGTHCGLGASACNPLRDTLKRFGQSYANRSAAPRFEPDFDLDAELSMARRVTGRDDPLAHLSNRDDT